MTESIGLKQQKKKARPRRLSDAMLGVFLLFCILLILKNSELASEHITRGLLLCARVVIPSLFPFMVLSDLLVSSGAAARLPRPLAAPLRWLLHLPDAGCSAVLLGLLCGFPVGARCAVASYQKGGLTKKQAERVLLCASGPSSAFLISAVGVSLWQSRGFGIALYLCTLFCQLLCGVFSAMLAKKEPIDNAASVEYTSSVSRLFVSSIGDSLRGILHICAYVVFFSAVTGTLGLVLSTLHLPPLFSAFLSCLPEISTGVSIASSLPDARVAAWLCAFASGWSGISVHCQMLATVDGSGLSVRPYLLAKLAQGVLCALLFGAILALFPELLLTAKSCG